MFKAHAISTERTEGRVATHYRLSEPATASTWSSAQNDYVDIPTYDVVVSAVRNAYVHETLVFRAYPDGTIADFSEMWGFRDTLDHAEVLALADYAII